MAEVRWLVLRVRFDESEQYRRLEPRDGDIVRLEEATGQSWGDLVDGRRWGTWTRLAWIVLRRLGDVRVSDDYNAFLDICDVALGDEAEVAANGEGKDSEPVPSPITSSSSLSLAEPAVSLSVPVNS